MTRGDVARAVVVGLLVLAALYASRTGCLAPLEQPLDDIQVALQPAAGYHPAVLLLPIRADAALAWDRTLDALEQLKDQPPAAIVLMPLPVQPTAAQLDRLRKLVATTPNLHMPGLLLPDGTLMANWLAGSDDQLVSTDQEGYCGVSASVDGRVRRVALRVNAPDGRVLQHVALIVLGPGRNQDVPDSIALNPLPGCIGILSGAGGVRGDIRTVVIEAVVPRLEPARYRLAGTEEQVTAGHITALALFNASRRNWRESMPAGIHLVLLIALAALIAPRLRRWSLWRSVPALLVLLPVGWIALGWVMAQFMHFTTQLPLLPAITLVLGLAATELHRRASGTATSARALETPLRRAWRHSRSDTPATGEADTMPPLHVTFGRIADLLTWVAPVPFRMDVLAYRPALERRTELSGQFSILWADGRDEARDCGLLQDEYPSIESDPLGRLIAGEGLTMRGMAGEGVTSLLVPARAERIDGTQLLGVVAFSTRHNPQQLMDELVHLLPAVAAEVARSLSGHGASHSLRRLESPRELPPADRLDLLTPLAEGLGDSLLQDRALLDALPIGVALLDLAGQVLWANPAFALIDARRSVPLSMLPPLPDLLQQAGAIPADQPLAEERLDLLEIAASGARGRYPLEIDGRPMLLTVRALHNAAPALRSEAVESASGVARRPGLMAVLVETAAESRWARTRAAAAELLAPLRGQIGESDLLSRLDQLLGITAGSPDADDRAPAAASASSRPGPADDITPPMLTPFDLLEVCTEAAESVGAPPQPVSPGPLPPTALGNRVAVHATLADLLRHLGQPATLQLRADHTNDGRPQVAFTLRPANGGSLSALRTELSLLVDDTRDRLTRLGGRLLMDDGRTPVSPDAVTVRVSFAPF